MPEFIYLIAWFLLPLIPAFLLFKFLPSTGQVQTPKNGKSSRTDPLNGLGIKFGGAFAGYLVLFFLSKEVLKDRMKKTDVSDEIWVIKGEIRSADNKFNAQDQEPAIKIDPHGQRIRDKNFSVTVIAKDDGTGYLEFPGLDFITLDYYTESLPDPGFNKEKRDISPQYVIENYKSHILRLKDTLMLKPLRVIQPMANNEEIRVDTSFSHN